jgi:hypothetical protein
MNRKESCCKSDRTISIKIELLFNMDDKIQNNSHFYMNKEFGIGHYSDELELFLCG